MKLVIVTTLILFSIGCKTQKVNSQAARKLNGSWIPISQEIGGKALPASVYKSEKLIINDSSYTVIAESVDKGVVKYHDDKLDIFGKEGVNAGKHFTAIYKLENEQLTVCYNLAGDAYPENFDSGKKASYFLSVFKKEPAK